MSEENQVEEENNETVAEDRTDAPVVRNPLWQSANVSTNEPGPSIEDVTHVFAEARAQALGNAVDALENNDGEVPEHVVLPNDPNVPQDNDEAIARLKDSAQAAQDEADAKAETGGLIDETNNDSESADAESDEDKADQAKEAAGDHK